MLYGLMNAMAGWKEVMEAEVEVIVEVEVELVEVEVEEVEVEEVEVMEVEVMEVEVMEVEVMEAEVEVMEVEEVAVEVMEVELVEAEVEVEVAEVAEARLRSIYGMTCNTPTGVWRSLAKRTTPRHPIRSDGRNLKKKTV